MNYCLSIEVAEAVKHRLGQYSDLIRQETEMPDAYEWLDPANYSILIDIVGDHNYPDLTGRGYIDHRFRNKERKLLRKIAPLIENLASFTLEFSEISFRAHLSFVASANVNRQYQTLFLDIRTILSERGLLYMYDCISPATVTLASYKIGRPGTPPDTVALIPKLSILCEVKTIVLERSETAEEQRSSGPANPPGRWRLVKKWRLD